MRIAYLANTDLNPNGFYRAVGPMTALAARGHDVRDLSAMEPGAQFHTVRRADVLFIHRYCDERHTIPLAREAKGAGVAVVWDEDDDMGSAPKDSPEIRKQSKLFWSRRLTAMKSLLRLVDLVTTPSAKLADQFLVYGAAGTRIIENCIPKLFLEYGGRKPHEGVVVGWLAGYEHGIDVRLLSIRQDLQRLLDERSEVHVVSIGTALNLAHDRYRHIRRVPFLEWSTLHDPKTGTRWRRFEQGGGLGRATAAFDIGIAPLADIPFNRCRSNVKLKEYAAGGTPWLASPVGSYLGMGEKQGGRLVPDNDSWYPELLRLVDRPRDRRKLAKRAEKWVQGETLEKNGHRWEEAFQEAIRLSGTKAGPSA